MVVDVSDTVSARKAKGPQRVMEDIIEHFRKYRNRFERIAAEQNGTPLSGVKLLSPIPRPSKCMAAFVNYVDRPDRSPESLPKPCQSISRSAWNRSVRMYGNIVA